MRKEIRSVMKSLPTKKSLGPHDFRAEVYQTLKTNANPSQTLFKICSRRDDSKITLWGQHNLIPNQNKNITKKNFLLQHEKHILKFGCAVLCNRHVPESAEIAGIWNWKFTLNSLVMPAYFLCPHSLRLRRVGNLAELKGAPTGHRTGFPQPSMSSVYPPSETRPLQRCRLPNTPSPSALFCGFCNVYFFSCKGKIISQNIWGFHLEYIQ
jgi:hypothetical protein